MAQDPLWDEEVVPALRKRLQSESKTLARRLSAISLPSGDEARSPPGPKVLNPQKHHSGQVQVQQQHEARQAKAKTQTQKLRQRTYSSPKNPHPTRIPKARQMSGGGSNLGGGYGRQPLPQSQENTPKPRPMPPSASSMTFDMPRSHTRGLGLLHESPPFPIDSMSSSSSAEGCSNTHSHAQSKRYGLGLGQPQTRADTDGRSQTEEDPPRPSIDSEERPYEHWYRGEVSRNGGVGELKVGRRQEMLDIANYGHFILSRKAGGGNGVGKNGKIIGGGAGGRENGYLDLLHLRRTRPRAGSIGGLTRKERDSLYLDEMDEEGVGPEENGSWRGDEGGGYWGERVLDQDPPTDFDKDDDDDDDEEDEDGIEENGDNEEGTPQIRREDESHTPHNVTHNLNHNYPDEQDEEEDFVFVNHPPQTTSDTQPYPYAYAYIPTEADVLNRSSTSDMSSNANVHTNGTPNANTGERWTPNAGAHQKTSTYPTVPQIASPTPPLPRPSSRQTQTSPPPSRIPYPSSSRRSSDSRSTYNGTSTPATTTTVPRATTPTSILPRPTRSKSEPPSSLGGAASTSNSTSTPGAPPPSSYNKRSTSPGSTSTPSSPPPSQVAPSTTSKTSLNARTKTNSKPKAKAKSKSKPPPTKREEKSDKRSSVAMYPTVEGGEELADAIPSWAQPVTREGNWDDVVLPVVARKKGLEGYFENTNPHLQLKKRQANGLAQAIVAPAPGTFGYDMSKYRLPRVGDAEGDEFVELDEFGVSKPPHAPEEDGAEVVLEDAYQKRHEHEGRNVYVPPNPNSMVQVHGQEIPKQRDEKDHGGEMEGGAGCCKCVVM